MKRQCIDCGAPSGIFARCGKHRIEWAAKARKRAGRPDPVRCSGCGKTRRNGIMRSCWNCGRPYAREAIEAARLKP